MKTLYIVRGLPGSGKSTYAKSLGIPHFEADMYFYKDGVYNFKQWHLQRAHEWCLDQVVNAITLGDSDVAVSNTFTTMKEVNPYLAIKEMCEGLRIVVVDVKTAYGSIHNVPEETLAKMSARWIDFPKQYCDELITIK